jgi:PhnB protein
MPAKAIPEGYHTVTATMNVKDAGKAIEFYRRAFGAEERFRMPSPTGAVMWAEIKIGDSVVGLSDAIKDPVQNFAGMLYVNDSDAVYKKAIEAGATSKSPITDMPWGDRGGSVTDAWGNSWFIVTHKEDVSPEEVKRRMQNWKPGQ